jgi:hypothetical protein
VVTTSFYYLVTASFYCSTTSAPRYQSPSIFRITDRPLLGGGSWNSLAISKSCIDTMTDGYSMTMRLKMASARHSTYQSLE